MAIIRAAQSGNWSSTSTWIGGVVPTSADDAVSNTFNITMDVSTTALSLRNDTSGGATIGGQFQFSVAVVSVTLTAAAPFNSSSSLANLVLVNNTTGTVNITITSAFAFNNVTTPITHTGAGAFIFTFPAITISGGNIPSLLTKTGSGALTLIGNVTGGGQGTATNIVVANSGTGAINVNGIVTGGNSTNSTQAITNSNATSTVTVNGNVVGGAGAAGSYAINSTGPVVISSGSVTCNSTANAILANGGITVSGTVTSNGGGIPIVITSAASAAITGNLIISSGTVETIQAITSAAASITLAGNFTNRAGRQAMLCRIIYLSNAVTNALTYNTPGGASRTLYSDDTFPNLPATTNVRFGTTYGPGLTNTGALVVPSPSTVLLGVPTDNTTGTLLMTPFDFITELNQSGIPVAVRMRNCATVATTGDQIASYGV